MEKINHNVHSKRKKVGLVLSGGGVKGISLIGVLDCLHKNHIRIDSILGVSIGSIVGAMYLYYKDPQIVANKLLTADFKDFVDISWFHLLFLPFSRKVGLCKGQNISQLLRHQLPESDISELHESFIICATNLKTLKPTFLKKGNLIDALLASSALPPYYAPVVYEGELFIDGAVSDPMPIQALRDEGMDIVIAVDISSVESDFSMSNMLEISYMSLDISRYYMIQEKLRQADCVISLNLNMPAISNPQDKNVLFNSGFDAAALCIDKIKSLISH